MDKTEFFEYCEKVLAANGLSEYGKGNALELYYRLSEELIEVNRHMNLTAITDMKGIILRHIADSLFLLKLADGARTTADVGCGAGFPSLPCAIAASIVDPSMKFYGFDSTKKRVDYVNATAKKLGLTNVTAICGRAEDIGRRADFRERFDVCSARAVSEAYVLSELCLPLVKVGGRMIALKGAKASEELSHASGHIPNLGGKARDLIEYSITDGDELNEYRAAMICDKVKATPDVFPRAYAKIIKGTK